MFNRREFIKRNALILQDNGKRFFVLSRWDCGQDELILDAIGLKKEILDNIYSHNETLIFDLENDGARIYLEDILEIKVNIPND